MSEAHPCSKVHSRIKWILRLCRTSCWTSPLRCQTPSPGEIPPEYACRRPRGTDRASCIDFTARHTGVAVNDPNTNAVSLRINHFPAMSRLRMNQPCFRPDISRSKQIKRRHNTAGNSADFPAVSLFDMCRSRCPVTKTNSVSALAAARHSPPG
jgi:hypothetical protein